MFALSAKLESSGDEAHSSVVLLIMNWPNGGSAALFGQISLNVICIKVLTMTSNSVSCQEILISARSSICYYYCMCTICTSTNLVILFFCDIFHLLILSQILMVHCLLKLYYCLNQSPEWYRNRPLFQQCHKIVIPTRNEFN